MKKYIVLDEDDIQKIITEKYKVPPTNVLVHVTQKSYGYGVMDRNVVEAKVTLEE